MGYRIGIDVGGTFTDLVLYDRASRSVVVEKVPSVPADPSQGIVDGIVRILEGAGVPASSVEYVGHGTTVATNTLIERKGARTALITTQGFRDLLEIARQKRPSLYDLQARKPKALVPRYRRHEVAERLLVDGTVRTPIDLSGLDSVLARLVELQAEEPIEALAICFLYSFLAPDHEAEAVRAARAALPDVAIVASHEVQPEFREYERLSTTVANAYLAPRMSAYVRAFQSRIRELGIAVNPYINQSNGGTVSVEEAARLPVRTVLSGPSAGVAGAVWIAAQAGLESIATFDMGGTSTDVAFVRGSEPVLAFDREIGGVPLRVPTLDIHTIGAGGGSIAWRDSGGALKVGPQSAGADPGPASYGRGGELPTVTDANVVLGRLGSTGLAGGAVGLDRSRAEEAISGLAKMLGLSAIETAFGIIRVVNTNMANAVRVVTVRRGVDPTGLALTAFGGAGPLHACELALELGIPTVAVPPAPGLLCALGLLVEDLRSDLVRTHRALLENRELESLADAFSSMESDAVRWLDREGVADSDRELERWLDLRYVGQNFELLVAAPEEMWIEGDCSALRQRFLEAHEQAYGFATADEPIQVVNLRVVARGRVDQPPLARISPSVDGRSAQPSCVRPVYLDDEEGFVDCPVYDRSQLLAGQRVAGPAVVEQFDSTTLVLPEHEALVDELGFLMIGCVATGDAATRELTGLTSTEPLSASR